MNKKKVLGIVALITIIIPSSLLLTGCPQHIDSLYGVKVTGDGAGGAIAVYEDKLGGLIYSQKIGTDGKTLWGEKGVRLVESNSKFYNFPLIHVISDGSGGALTAMPSTPSTIVPKNTYDVFKITVQGQAIPLAVLKSVDQLVSDGAGGVILDYSPDGKTLFVVRIDSNGNFPWGKEGVLLPRSGNTRQIASDGSGGAVITWLELQYPPEAKPGETISTGRIYAQKINGEGKLEWGDGVLLYTTQKDTYAESPQIIGDGAGGAIVVWQQVPNRRIEDGSPEALMIDILVQRVDASGKILWRENGLPLEVNKTAGRALLIEPKPISDGSGGVIVVWRDMRNRTGNTATLYAQRVDAVGNIMWQPGGINVSADAINPNHMIVSDGTGTAFVSYFFSESRKDLHVQKVDAEGKTIWTENGVQVAGGDYAGYSIAPDGQGGVIVGWGVGKGTFSSEKAYVQRISADGRLLWGEDGVRLNP